MSVILYSALPERIISSLADATGWMYCLAPIEGTASQSKYHVKKISFKTKDARITDCRKETHNFSFYCLVEWMNGYLFGKYDKNWLSLLIKTA